MRPWVANLTGLGLFLFIPLVLFLYVRHPEPVAASLVAGVLLMLGHRFLARPYMERVRTAKCIWCNRFPDAGASRDEVQVEAPGGVVSFSACPQHAPPARRFFDWVDRLRLPLRLGIGLPLVALLAALAADAFGHDRFVAGATEAFRLVVGLTVHLAALGALLGRAHADGEAPPRAAFPLHNFSLLGLRNILWIFRLVGVWWIWAGGRALLGLIAGRTGARRAADSGALR